MNVHGGIRWVLLALGLGLALAAPAAEQDELWIVGPQDLDKVWTMDRESWKASIDQTAVKALGAGCAFELDGAPTKLAQLASLYGVDELLGLTSPPSSASVPSRSASV